MLNEFQQHIEDQFPELLHQTFLLACSGGIDSVVLAHLCAEIKLQFAIAHCNFRLRGEDSDADENFVRDLAKGLNVPFYVTHFDTNAYVEQQKISVMMAARELRYDWFFKIMEQEGYKALVTAHQWDDDLETFIINLSRGTGLQGLLGIPKKTSRICRPLMPFTRENILSYAQSQGIQWREDSSNKQTKYLRNKIRHQIVPLLKELHPTFVQNFTNTQQNLVKSQTLLDAHMSSLRNMLFENRNGKMEIKVASLQKLDPLGSYLYELFRPYGFTEWHDVQHLLKAMSGKEVRSKTHRLLRNRETLQLEAISPPENEIYFIESHQKSIACPVALEICEVAEIGETSSKILYVDQKKLKYPLTVRKWQTGDYFIPFGMYNKKQVSKFFKDSKISVFDKEKQWILCSGEHIIWVIGQRADDRFKVTPTTKKIVKFTLRND